jgi:hypothetical protein
MENYRFHSRMQSFKALVHCAKGDQRNDRPKRGSPKADPSTGRASSDDKRFDTASSAVKLNSIEKTLGGAPGTS